MADAPETETQTTPTPGEAPAPAPTADSGHHGLIVFLGVLALILLLIGAVGVSAQQGSPASLGDRGQPDAGPGRSGVHGPPETKAERRARREAEKQQRKALQQERKAQRMGGRGPQGSDDADNDGAATVTEQTGTVATRTSADGATDYVLQTAAGDLVLDVGPPHFWGEDHPLAPLVGQTVTATGVLSADGHQLAVWTVGDLVIRGQGRPPWAGGWHTDGQKAPTTSPVPSPSALPSPTP